MNDRLSNTTDAMRDALQHCSVSAIKAALSDCEDVLHDEDGYPEELFAAVIDLLQSNMFVACSKSWLVLHHLYANEDALSASRLVVMGV
jgi:hypothetical protein